LKLIGDQHGDLHAPQPGGDGEGARSSAPDHFVIVNLPDDFDINSVFRSEQELSETTTAAPAAEVRANPELLSHDRAEAPSLSVADLIDNHVRLEWHEAVAITQHLCRAMSRDPAANVHHSLVEPWNVEITDSGDIQVLPGGSSSDPLVRQVGRVLRALLHDSIAPAELRLVASQASFEVPVYSSVDELSAALRHFARPGELDAIRAAFQRGLEAKFSVSPMYARVAPVAEPQAVDQSRTPKEVPATSPVLPRSRSRSFSRMALAAAALILIASALVMGLRTYTSEESPVASTPELQRRQVETQPSTPPARREIVPEPSRPPVTVPPLRPVPDNVAPAVSHRVFRPLAGPQAANVPATPSPRSTAPTQRPVAAGTGDSLEAERRAAGLFASGRPDDAAIIFDAIVMRNPFYHLDPARSSPEALSALRTSKQTLLPALARGHYQEARAAFDASDFSLAIAEGERALALLNDVDIGGGPADLNAEVPNLLALASAARTVEEERIYTIAGPGVTPPRPLGRQLSTASLLRISLKPTGRFEILVGRSGRVETVRLNTPSNGYHDRMIVSAVKAWHYRPALRNGKPVRFSLVMSITLPDS